MERLWKQVRNISNNIFNGFIRSLFFMDVFPAMNITYQFLMLTITTFDTTKDWIIYGGMTRSLKEENVQIYNTNNPIVNRVLLFVAESWRMTESDEKKIIAVEIDELRRSCNVFRREKIRNALIRQMLNTKYIIVDEIEWRKFILFG